MAVVGEDGKERREQERQVGPGCILATEGSPLMDASFPKRFRLGPWGLKLGLEIRQE